MITSKSIGHMIAYAAKYADQDGVDARNSSEELAY